MEVTSSLLTGILLCVCVLMPSAGKRKFPSWCSPRVLCLEIKGLVFDVGEILSQAITVPGSGSWGKEWRWVCFWGFGNPVDEYVNIQLRQYLLSVNRNCGRSFLAFEEVVTRNHITHQNNWKCFPHPLLCFQIWEIGEIMHGNISNLWCWQPWTLSSVEFSHQEKKRSMLL